MERNPILEQENYFKEYQDNINNLKNKPEVIEFDKLCFELFEMNPQGKKFLEIVKEKYVLPAFFKPGSPTYAIDIVWSEGFKEFFRMLHFSVKSHQSRIAAGK